MDLNKFLEDNFKKMGKVFTFKDEVNIDRCINGKSNNILYK
jgi:hypothetical protein